MQSSIVFSKDFRLWPFRSSVVSMFCCRSVEVPSTYMQFWESVELWVCVRERERERERETEQKRVWDWKGTESELVLCAQGGRTRLILGRPLSLTGTFFVRLVLRWTTWWSISQSPTFSTSSATLKLCQVSSCLILVFRYLQTYEA